MKKKKFKTRDFFGNNKSYSIMRINLHISFP